MTIPEALWIVSQNQNGIAMNYWDEYLPAILLINKTWSITGYRTVEENDDSEQDYVTWKQEQNEHYDRRHER